MSAFDVDVLVIGSGFGGSVAALRLTEKGYGVAVLESGSRFAPTDFARTNWNLRRYLFMPRLGLRGIQRLTVLDDLVVLSGAGVGGGSLVYANTLYEPLDPFFADPQWAGVTDWRAELAPYYDRARSMLGATEVPFESAAEDVIREVARRVGAEDTFRRTTVAVDFDLCVRCGGCMVGCRYGAKNTLDRNYLLLAEEARRTCARRARGDAAPPGRRRLGGRDAPFRCVAAAEARALPRGARRARGRRARHAGAAASLRRRRPERRRARALELGGDRRRRRAQRPRSTTREGIAIGSSFHPNADTRIEPVRYPKGSSLMGLFSTVLVDGGGRVPRPLRWAGTCSGIRSTRCRRTSRGAGRSGR